MNEARLSRGKSSVVVYRPRARRDRGQHRHRYKTPMLWVSLGSLILGIGLICWALTNIGAQSVRVSDAYSDTYRSLSSTATTAAVKKGNPKPDGVAPKKPDQPSDTRALIKVSYAKNPKQGDTLGSLSIPALGQELPIIEGTGADDLKKGVGHFTKSVMPGQKDNCVLSGHRDTVFSELGTLKIGDRLIVQTSAGIYTYQIKRTRIVHANDRTVIVPTKRAVLTLTTCYPFDFIGSAPDRYIVSANLVAGK
jgi:sortase A